MRNYLMLSDIELSNLTWGAIIIDMQPGFIYEFPFANNRLRTLRYIRSALDNIALKSIPLAVVEARSPFESLDAGSITEELSVKLKHMPNYQTFEKYKDDAFSNPDIARYFNSLAVEVILFMGIHTYACLGASVEGAWKNRFAPATCHDIIAPRFEWQRNSKHGYFNNNTIYRPTLGRLLRILPDQNTSFMEDI